jgi:hypothetical protein
MKKLNLNMYPLDIQKIRAIEVAFNELLQILADNGIIELEEDNDTNENNDE